MSKIQKSSDNSDPKINFLIFFLDFLSFFWYYPKVGSLFGSDNSEPKIIFDFFLDFFGVKNSKIFRQFLPKNSTVTWGRLTLMGSFCQDSEGLEKSTDWLSFSIRQVFYKFNKRLLKNTIQIFNLLSSNSPKQL